MRVSMYFAPSGKKKQAKKPAKPSPSSSASEAIKVRPPAVVRAPSPSSVDFRVGTHTVRSGIEAGRLGSVDLSTLAEHQREAQPDVADVLDRDADRARHEETERTSRELRKLRKSASKRSEPRRGRSEPRDLGREGAALFLQTLRTPRPARPTMTTIDDEHRPRETHGFVLPEAATAGRP